MHSWSSHSGLCSFFPLVATFSFWYNIMIKVHQHALINLVYSYMVTKVFNIQPVLFHQYYLCHLLWFKKQSFTLVWKPNPPLLSLLRAPSRSCWCSECRLPTKRSRWKSISSRVQWNMAPATMCCGSAARRRFGATDHALAQVPPHQFFTGGGVMRLTAKPRYLLLLHRGKEKSITVTALIFSKPIKQSATEDD